MIYDVISMSLGNDGGPLYHDGRPIIRVETINTETNGIFKECGSAQEVAAKYESFWQDDDHPRGQCEVLRVILCANNITEEVEDNELVWLVKRTNPRTFCSAFNKFVRKEIYPVRMERRQSASMYLRQKGFDEYAKVLDEEQLKDDNNMGQYRRWNK